MEIKGIYNTVSMTDAPEVGNDPDTGQRHLRLVSDEKIYNVGICRLKEGEVIDESKWIRLRVQLTDPDAAGFTSVHAKVRSVSPLMDFLGFTRVDSKPTVEVYADVNELAARLGKSPEELLANRENPNYIQQTIEDQLKHKPLESKELRLFKLPGLSKKMHAGNERGGPKYENLDFNKQEVVDIYKNVLKNTNIKDEKVAKAVAHHAEGLIHKILLRHPELNNEKYLPGLKTAALLIAQKYQLDAPLNNKAWASIFNMNITDLNNLEELFFREIDMDAGVILPEELP